MKKLLPYILILIALIGGFVPFFNIHAAGSCIDPTNTTREACEAAEEIWNTDKCIIPGVTTLESCEDVGGRWTEGTTSTTTNYTFLAPLPCEAGKPGCTVSGELAPFDPTQANNLGVYLNIMLRIFIGICAVLAVIMIVLGGMEYMTSELLENKAHGKERITNAIFGLILALGAYTLLFTINPDLLKTDLSSLKDIEITVDLGGEGTGAITASNEQLKTSAKINCNGGGASALTATAQSFIGNSTYSRERRGTVDPATNKAYIDCSSFVTQVYTCAGLSNPGGTSAGIFSSAARVTNISSDGTTINGVALKTGDLIGWKQGENGENWGHVMMYIGNGQMIDAQGQGGVGVRPVASYAKRIKYVKPL